MELFILTYLLNIKIAFISESQSRYITNSMIQVAVGVELFQFSSILYHERRNASDYDSEAPNNFLSSRSSSPEFFCFSQSLLFKMDADQVFLTQEVYAKTEA